MAQHSKRRMLQQQQQQQHVYGNYRTGEHRIFDHDRNDEASAALSLPVAEDMNAEPGISQLSVENPLTAIGSQSNISTFSPTSILPWSESTGDNSSHVDAVKATTNSSSDSDSNSTGNITFTPGLITTIENGLMLSEGLKSRVIAESGRKVRYYNREKSTSKFHTWPDGGDVFVDTRAENPGGWVLISNSEEDIVGAGGVGAITFDREGNVIDYRMLLTGTTMNCNGGRTHFGAWISCEEDFVSSKGRAWQVDPTGVRESKPITLGSDGGIFESFSYDIRDPGNAHFFLTEDDQYGAMQRFTPTNPDWDSPWDILTGQGTIDYLVLLPNQNDHTKGIYTWIDDKKLAQENAAMFYPYSEGIEVVGNTLFMVCKEYRHLYELDLDRLTYTRQSTVSGLFDGTPDQIRKVIVPADEDAGIEESGTMLYFTEDGGERAGIHARDLNGEIYTILEGMYQAETTGLCFSPDLSRMYFAFQEDGMLFEVQRIDGQPFNAKTVNLKNHKFDGSHSSSTRHERREQRGRYHR